MPSSGLFASGLPGLEVENDKFGHLKKISGKKYKI